MTLRKPWSVYGRFQFPSNGKVFPNEFDSGMKPDPITLVSIPFKREGLSEREDGIEEIRRITVVSIPFKREGLSEHR